MKKDTKIFLLFAMLCLGIGHISVSVAYAVAALIALINSVYMVFLFNIDGASPRSIAKFKASDPIASCALALVVWSAVFGALFGLWGTPLLLTPIAFVAASGITTALILRK